VVLIWKHLDFNLNI